MITVKLPKTTKIVNGSSSYFSTFPILISIHLQNFNSQFQDIFTFVFAFELRIGMNLGGCGLCKTTKFL